MVGAVLGNLFSINGIALLGALAITAALGLRSPLILVLVPTLLARFVSHREVYLEMKYYYDGPLMVVCVLALVVALQQRRIRLGDHPGADQGVVVKRIRTRRCGHAGGSGRLQRAHHRATADV